MTFFDSTAMDFGGTVVINTTSFYAHSVKNSTNASLRLAAAQARIRAAVQSISRSAVHEMYERRRTNNPWYSVFRQTLPQAEPLPEAHSQKPELRRSKACHHDRLRHKRKKFLFRLRA